MPDTNPEPIQPGPPPSEPLGEPNPESAAPPVQSPVPTGTPEPSIGEHLATSFTSEPVSEAPHASNQPLNTGDLAAVLDNNPKFGGYDIGAGQTQESATPQLPPNPEQSSPPMSTPSAIETPAPVPAPEVPPELGVTPKPDEFLNPLPPLSSQEKKLNPVIPPEHEVIPTTTSDPVSTPEITPAPPIEPVVAPAPTETPYLTPAPEVPPVVAVAPAPAETFPPLTSSLENPVAPPVNPLPVTPAPSAPAAPMEAPAPKRSFVDRLLGRNK